jgi:hypothetical protein
MESKFEPQLMVGVRVVLSLMMVHPNIERKMLKDFSQTKGMKKLLRYRANSGVNQDQMLVRDVYN